MTPGSLGATVGCPPTRPPTSYHRQRFSVCTLILGSCSGIDGRNISSRLCYITEVMKVWIILCSVEVSLSVSLQIAETFVLNGDCILIEKSRVHWCSVVRPLICAECVSHQTPMQGVWCSPLCPICVPLIHVISYAALMVLNNFKSTAFKAIVAFRILSGRVLERIKTSRTSGHFFFFNQIGPWMKGNETN